jgi:hypothetical protein
VGHFRGEMLAEAKARNMVCVRVGWRGDLETNTLPETCKPLLQAHRDVSTPTFSMNW